MSPYVEVSHLPSSASFYSAVLQPLGLYCISPTPTGNKELQASVAYGLSQSEIELEVRQSVNPLKSPRLSRLVLRAPTKASVSAFHDCWLRADPPSWSPFRDNRGLEQLYDDRQRALEGPWTVTDNGVPVTRAVVYDHVGNRLEAVYHGRGSRNSRGKTGVLEWDFDIQTTPQSNTVKSSSLPGGLFSSMAPFQSLGSNSHASTSSSVASNPPVSQDASTLANPRESSRSGLNTQTVVGALLGAAAGAAVTYGLVSGSKEETPEQNDEVKHRAGLTRRATFPEKPVTGQYYPKHYEKSYEKHYPRSKEYETPRRLSHPHLQSLSIRDPYGQEDDDVEYGVDTMTVARYHPQPPSSRGRDPNRSMVPPRITEDPETRSRRSSRASHGRSASMRARSETPRDRVPVPAEEDWDRRSHTSRRSAAKPESTVSRPPLSKSHRSNAESYISTRSRRSSSTVRSSSTSRPDRESQQYEPRARSRSRAPSYASSANQRGRSRDPSRASTARGVPLPDSVAGTSLADWEDDVSAAPSRMTARGVPLPDSVIGSSHADWHDGASRVSRMTARGVPLPSSVGGSHADWDDNASRASSRMTAKGVPLPDSVVGSSHADWRDNASRASSRMTAKGVPLPDSVVGSSHADWRDNASRASSGRMTARGIPLPDSVADDSEADWDIGSQASSQMTARGNRAPESVSGNSRTHWEPQDIPMPRSRVGSSHAGWDDFYDDPQPHSRSRASSHADWQDARSRAPSHLSAKAIPIPESRAGSSYTHWQDARSRAPSQMTAKGVPLPDSEVGSSHAHWDPRDVALPRSRVGSSHAHWDPHDVALPRSHAGSSHAHWDPWDVPLPKSGVGNNDGDWADDMESLAPDDSVSCVGTKSSRRSRRRN